MNAREEILGRVRTALADVQATNPVEDVPVAWAYEQPTAMPDVVERFVERVEDYKATVVRVGGSDEEIAAAVVAGLQSLGAADAVVPAGLPQAWCEAVAAAGVEVVRDDPPLGNDRLNAIGAVVTAAVVGAAESGTIMLDHGPDQGRRALSLVPDAHICVVRVGQVVSDIPQAVGRLQESIRQGQPITWISGPSATSDIELSRVEGVHGPRTLHVVLAG
ncbi:LutC/YkgG family protein [Luteococcus sp. Sow4_B9]|uniref:LutC/YkgG family protein n=1 Tax=Luteococcus sp. Sow4_B9 TaxID=3438792 RepID=UPI003F9BC725